MEKLNCKRKYYTTVLSYSKLGINGLQGEIYLTSNSRSLMKGM